MKKLFVLLYVTMFCSCLIDDDCPYGAECGTVIVHEIPPPVQYCEICTEPYDYWYDQYGEKFYLTDCDETYDGMQIVCEYENWDGCLILFTECDLYDPCPLWWQIEEELLCY